MLVTTYHWILLYSLVYSGLPVHASLPEDQHILADIHHLHCGPGHRHHDWSVYSLRGSGKQLLVQYSAVSFGVSLFMLCGKKFLTSHTVCANLLNLFPHLVLSVEEYYEQQNSD